MFVKPDNWNELTPEEKQAVRFDHWQSAADDIPFVSPEAEAKYKERQQRLRDAYDLATPDRIIADVSMGAGEYALRRAGLNGRDMLYHHEKICDPVINFNLEFDPDVAVNAFVYPGKVLDLFGLETYVWSGQKLPDHLVIQAVEGEYMTGDEYKDFIKDPSNFMMKTYIPRMFSELSGLSMMPDFLRVTEIVDVASIAAPFATPPMQDLLQKLLTSGQLIMEYFGVMGQVGGALAANGFPSTPGSSFAKTPFDFLGDTLRGTKGIMMDMYRRPDELLAACEAYVPILIDQLTKSCDMTGAAAVMYPLHKGADGFMSPAQFDKFYWPTFKAVMMGLWEEGIMNVSFVEGSYDSRLEYLADMPKGSTAWMFDQTDMRKAKELLEGNSLIMGNVPASLMSTGSVDDLRAYCDGLVELFDGSPGYIMSFGCGFETTTDEKVRAFIDSVR